VSILLVLVIALILTAWFGGLAFQFLREIAKARWRCRTASERERKILAMIKNMLDEEKSLYQQIKEQTEANLKLQNEVNALRSNLMKQQTINNKRLLVINGRRQVGDKDWIVTLANPTPLRPDSHPTVIQEWARGRDYLLWARTEGEARERALRRFHTRPGTILKGIIAAPPDLLTGEITGSTLGSSTTTSSR
jgi:hypothetical protein